MWVTRSSGLHAPALLLGGITPGVPLSSFAIYAARAVGAGLFASGERGCPRWPWCTPSRASWVPRAVASLARAAGLVSAALGEAADRWLLAAPVVSRLALAQAASSLFIALFLALGVRVSARSTCGLRHARLAPAPLPHPPSRCPSHTHDTQNNVIAHSNSVTTLVVGQALVGLWAAAVAWKPQGILSSAAGGSTAATAGGAHLPGVSSRPGYAAPGQHAATQGGRGISAHRFWSALAAPKH